MFTRFLASAWGRGVEAQRRNRDLEEVNLANQLISQMTMDGSPIHAGDWAIIPIARALTVRLPGNVGGFTWNRPAGVRVVRSGQPDQFLAIPDPTRLILIAMFAGLFAWMVTIMVVRRRR